MNGGVRLGAVARAYIGRIIILKGVLLAEVLAAPLAHVRSSHSLGYAPAEKFGILDFLRWPLMHLINKNRACQCPTKITYFGFVIVSVTFHDSF